MSDRAQLEEEVAQAMFPGFDIKKHVWREIFLRLAGRAIDATKKGSK